MQVVHERCCGLDVHKKAAVACVVDHGREGEGAESVCTFRTLTSDLLAPRGLAGGHGRDAPDDGVDGRVLAAGVQHPGGRP